MQHLRCVVERITYQNEQRRISGSGVVKYMEKNTEKDVSMLMEMPEWEGVLDALLSCDPGHADLLEALIRNLKPIETPFDAQNSWMAEYQNMIDEMEGQMR
jgi:hypothetical protein